MLKGPLGGVEIGFGNFVCLDLLVANSAPNLDIQDVRCVYGRVSAGEHTRFKGVEELRIRIERVQSLTRSDDLNHPIPRPTAFVEGTKFLELESGDGIDVGVSGKLEAAHVKPEGSSEVFVGDAQMIRFGRGPDEVVTGEDRRTRQADEGFVCLDGVYGTVVNRAGPPMQVAGTIERIVLDTDACWIDLDRARITLMAGVFFWSEAHDPPLPLWNSTFHAAEGHSPLLCSPHPALVRTGDWLQYDRDFSETFFNGNLRFHEADVWRGAPSAIHEAARVLAQREAAAQRYAQTSADLDPLEPPQPATKRVRHPTITGEPFGSGDTLSSLPPVSGPSRRQDPPSRGDLGEGGGRGLEFDI